jgi:hypothetical protein
MVLSIAAYEADDPTSLYKRAKEYLDLARRLKKQGRIVAIAKSEVLILEKQHPDRSDWVNNAVIEEVGFEVVDDLAYHSGELQGSLLDIRIMQFAAANAAADGWKVAPLLPSSSAYSSHPDLVLSKADLEQMLEEEQANSSLPLNSSPTGSDSDSQRENFVNTRSIWKQLIQTFLILLVWFSFYDGSSEETSSVSSSEGNRRPPNPDPGDSSLDSGKNSFPPDDGEVSNNNDPNSGGGNKTSQNHLTPQADREAFAADRTTGKGGFGQYNNVGSIDRSSKVDKFTENVTYNRLDHSIKQVPTLDLPSEPTVEQPGVGGEKPIQPDPILDPPSEPTVEQPGVGGEKPIQPDPILDPPSEPTVEQPGVGGEKPIQPDPILDPPSEPTVEQPGVGGEKPIQPDPIDPPSEPTVEQPGVGGEKPIQPDPIDPPSEPTAEQPGVGGEKPIQPDPTLDPPQTVIDLSNGNQSIPVSGNVLLTIDAFGGVGRGSQPAPDIIKEIDTLQFNGVGLTARNMILTQEGDHLVITFESVSNTKVVLQNFALENIDNLPSATGILEQIGNILFDGDTQIQDSFDVLNADTITYQVWGRDTVIFLNDLDNTVSGYDNSNDVINGQGGNDFLLGLGGDDVLRGGDGNDVLTGGAGMNTLTGNEGSDIFVLLSDGFSKVTDFTLGQDFIQLPSGIEAKQITIEQGISINANNTFIKHHDTVLMALSGVQANTLTIDMFSPATLP